MPLAHITLMCGPNGSGKSTALDAFRSLILDDRKPKTKESVEALVTGTAMGVCFISSEWDNPRLFAKRGPDGQQVHSQMLSGHEVAIGMLMQERSHGQSNYDQLQYLLQCEQFDVLVLDEPENALDLDGLIWLRQEILKSSKQFIIATHNLLLLSLAKSAQAQVNIFGNDPLYLERILDVYGAAIAGKSLGRPKARLKVPSPPKPKVKPVRARPSFLSRRTVS